MIKYKDKKWYQLWWLLRRIRLWNHANHQCLLKTAGPPFLFSVSLHRLSNKQLNCSTNECFPSQHHINFALPQQPLTEGSSIDTGWPKVMRTERNGRIYVWIFLSITLGDYRRGQRGPVISINHELYISPLYLYLYTLLLCYERHFCKICTRRGLNTVVFSFLCPLWCWQTQQTQMSRKLNQGSKYVQFLVEIIKSTKDLHMFVLWSKLFF